MFAHLLIFLCLFKCNELRYQLISPHPDTQLIKYLQYNNIKYYARKSLPGVSVCLCVVYVDICIHKNSYLYSLMSLRSVIYFVDPVIQ